MFKVDRSHNYHLIRQGAGNAVANGLAYHSAINGLSSNDFGAALDATNFAANGAALLTFDDAGTTRTFLAINDSTDGFDNRRDAVIELIDPVGDLNQMEIF